MRGRSPLELTVTGEKGFLRLHAPFYKSQRITVETEGQARTFERPFDGNGYVHEALEVQRCLRAGLLESPRMPHDESVHLMGVMDEIRRQVGLEYAADTAD
jgi:hypothetical protein